MRGARRLEPFASGAYVNVLSDDGASGVRRAYPPAVLCPADRDQGCDRPGERLPPQSEHPAEPEGGDRVRTIFAAYRVSDLDRSLVFYTALGYRQLGQIAFQTTVGASPC